MKTYSRLLPAAVEAHNWLTTCFCFDPITLLDLKPIFIIQEVERQVQHDLSYKMLRAYNVMWWHLI